ncbi:hypothetical protein [Streptomyces sp. NPDC001833]|uniref:hypothetical protein n=1 Tax=Streptomyces sp. NPDC001833 TaxID=3154658 RepID=UPI003333A90E
MKRRSAQVTVMVPAVVLMSAMVSSASAVTAPADPETTVTRVRTVAAFDFAAGEAAENIVLAPDGSQLVSMLGSPAGRPPQLLRLSPSGRRTVLVAGELGDTFSGIARGSDGTVYYNVLSADASRSGVWKLPPAGAPRRIAALSTDAFPNGLALDDTGRTLYVSDTHKSTVYAVPTAGGTATPWLVDQALASTQPEPSDYGANGLRFHNGAVWVANTNQGTLLRIPVRAGGGPGGVRLVSRDVEWIDDFSFLSARSDVVFAALNGADRVAVVYPDGTAQTVLTAADGLASPTSTAVRGRWLYITDSGIAQDPHDSKLQRARIDLVTHNPLSVSSDGRGQYTAGPAAARGVAVVRGIGDASGRGRRDPHGEMPFP